MSIGEAEERFFRETMPKVEEQAKRLAKLMADVERLERLIAKHKGEKDGADSNGNE